MVIQPNMLAVQAFCAPAWPLGALAMDAFSAGGTFLWDDVHSSLTPGGDFFADCPPARYERLTSVSSRAFRPMQMMFFAAERTKHGVPGPATDSDGKADSARASMPMAIVPNTHLVEQFCALPLPLQQMIRKTLVRAIRNQEVRDMKPEFAVAAAFDRPSHEFREGVLTIEGKEYRRREVEKLIIALIEEDVSPDSLPSPAPLPKNSQTVLPRKGPGRAVSMPAVFMPEEDEELRRRVESFGGARPYPLIGAILQLAIERGRTTRQGLVDATGYGQAFVSRIVRGDANIPLRAIRAFALAMGYDETSLRRTVNEYSVIHKRWLAQRDRRNEIEIVWRGIQARLASRRRELGKTQKEVGARLGVSHKMIGRIERSSSLYKPGRARFKALLGILEFPEKEAAALMREYETMMTTLPARIVTKPYEELGRYIEGLGRQLGMTRREMAMALGMNYRTLGLLAVGRAPFPEGRIGRLAEVTGTDAADLRRMIAACRKNSMRDEVPRPFEAAGDILREALGKRGSSASEAARALAISESFLFDIMSGTSRVPDKRIHGFARYFGVPEQRLREEIDSVVSNPPHREFGGRIKDARKRTRENLRDFAERVGISNTRLSLIENGFSLPSPKEGKRLKEALGIIP